MGMLQGETSVAWILISSSRPMEQTLCGDLEDGKG